LTYHHDDGDASFFDKFELLHKSVYSTDGKKLGFVKKVFPYNIVIQSEFTWLRKYIVSKSSIAHVSKKDIKLKLTAYEVRHRYSYPKVKNILIPLKNITKTSSTTTVGTKAKRLFLEIYESIQYSRWQRNQLAAVIAFVSGIVFLISGYKVDVTFYYLIQKEILSNLPSNLWPVVIISMEIIVIISRLGGITVLIGAALFAANRVNLGKLWIGIGTGQGLFTIALRVTYDVWSGRIDLANNYVLWLMSSATGLGILFSVIARSVSKGESENTFIRIIKFIFIKRRTNR
jgi:sporulation protein YlmC with PRC-barrel domain